MRPLFLNNPRRWTQAPRRYESPAEYAEPIHGGPAASYPRGWWLIVILCGLAGLFLTFTAKAQTVVGLHTVSIHAPDNGKVNNVNPGGFVSFDNCATVGFYRNSLRRMSVYAGCTKERGLAGVTIGAVTGYDKEHDGNSNYPLAPLLALHLKSPVAFFGATPRLTYIPGHLVKSADVLHLSMQWSIK